MKPRNPVDLPHTEQAIATVLSCTYTAGVGRAVAFGLPTSRHFRIVYNFYANGEFHTGKFESEKPIPQGTLFPITYDTGAPHRHDHGHSVSPASVRKVQIVVGIMGSLLFSLVWWLLLHARG